MSMLIHLGVIILIFCVLVQVLEGVNSGRSKRERAYRQQMIIDAWKRDHPDQGGAS